MISDYKEFNLTNGKIINIETEYIYYLSEGAAQLWEVNSDGEEILINVLKSDDAIRMPNISFKNIYELRTNSKESNFYIYKWNPVNSIEEKYFLLNKVTTTLMRTETLNFIKRQKFVKDRVISLFYFLVQEYGEFHEDNRFVINELFTHEQLASLVLSTRTTITRILNELKKENIISYLNGHICLDKKLANSNQMFG